MRFVWYANESVSSSPFIPIESIEGSSQIFARWHRQKAHTYIAVCFSYNTINNTNIRCLFYVLSSNLVETTFAFHSSTANSKNYLSSNGVSGFVSLSPFKITRFMSNRSWSFSHWIALIIITSYVLASIINYKNFWAFNPSYESLLVCTLKVTSW